MGLDAIPDWESLYCIVCGNSIEYNIHIDPPTCSCHRCKMIFSAQDLRDYKFTFKPQSIGCAEYCPIELNEKEVCCKQGRVCCFYCYDKMCNIQEIYKIIINYIHYSDRSKLTSSVKSVLERLRRI